jgi:MAF protein
VYHWLQTALAAQRETTGNIDSQSRPAIRVQIPGKTVSDVATPLRQQLAKPHQPCYRDLALERASTFREFTNVDNRVFAHKRANVLFWLDFVKEDVALSMARLVLASTSPYRRELLARLGVPFETAAPGVDETPRVGEPPAATANRLAREKAAALAQRFPDAFIVGADQVAEIDGEALGKPLSHAVAVRQLRRCSGRTVDFHTGVCVLDAASGTMEVEVTRNRVRFRPLDEGEIERYLQCEQPYDCAGSAKVEGYGIVLIEALEGEDPNALIGLPLIRLAAMLRRAGFRLP